MTYTTDIEINLPISRVIELFDNPENMKQWMKGLISFEPLSGTPGQPGAKSRLVFTMGKRRVEMIETITVRNLPDEFSGTYEAEGVFNLVKNRFVELPNQRTQYISEQEFEFHGAMKLLGALMPGMFKKQTQQYLQDFKQFAEAHK